MKETIRLTQKEIEELKRRSLVKSFYKKNTELSIASLQSLKRLQTGNRKLSVFFKNF